MPPHTNWGNGFHGEPQKERSNWCDWFGVRVQDVMKWHSLYQSVSHPVTAVVPWIRPATQGQPPLLHMATALPLGNSLSSSFSCLFLSPSLLLQLLSQLYKLSLFSLLFFSTPTLALWEEEGGSMLRGVEFFIVLGTRGDPSQGTLPFPSRFFFSLSPFKLPSSTPSIKSRWSLPSKPVFFISLLLPGLFFSHMCVCVCVHVCFPA